MSTSYDPNNAYGNILSTLNGFIGQGGDGGSNAISGGSNPYSYAPSAAFAAEGLARNYMGQNFRSDIDTDMREGTSGVDSATKGLFSLGASTGNPYAAGAGAAIYAGGKIYNHFKQIKNLKKMEGQDYNKNVVSTSMESYNPGQMKSLVDEKNPFQIDQKKQRYGLMAATAFGGGLGYSLYKKDMKDGKLGQLKRLGGEWQGRQDENMALANEKYRYQVDKAQDSQLTRARDFDMYKRTQGNPFGLPNFVG